MSYQSRTYDTANGDPVVVLVTTGTRDVARLIHLLSGAAPTSEQIRVGSIVLGQVKRHNGGSAALRFLADHGGPDFTDDDHPGFDRYCDWPGCLNIWHAVTGGPGWKRSRRLMLCPVHNTTTHWADYTLSDDGTTVTGALCDCGHRWEQPPISLGVLKAWWQQHVAPPTTRNERAVMATETSQS